jgi:hypothetical protein
LNELYTTLNKLPAKEIVVLLDSCFSCAAGRSVLAKGARPMVISIENPLLANGKIVVLAAATANQISSDYDKAQHGLFTHFLLAGLGGEADKDQDKVVTLGELFPYVRDQVVHTAVEELNREQTPVPLPGEDVLGQHLSMPLAWAVFDGGALSAQGSKKAGEPDRLKRHAFGHMKSRHDHASKILQKPNLLYCSLFRRCRCPHPAILPSHSRSEGLMRTRLARAFSRLQTGSPMVILSSTWIRVGNRCL